MWRDPIEISSAAQEAAEILGSDGSFARLTHAAVGPLWPTDLAAAAGLFASTASAERQESGMVMIGIIRSEYNRYTIWLTNIAMENPL